MSEHEHTNLRASGGTERLRGLVASWAHDMPPNTTTGKCYPNCRRCAVEAALADSPSVVTDAGESGECGAVHGSDKYPVPASIPESAAPAPTVDDGFGNVWAKECPEPGCGGEMQVMRPGKVQCSQEHKHT
jgi:hypothetical protein